MMKLLCKYCEEEFECVKNSLAYHKEVCDRCYLFKIENDEMIKDINKMMIVIATFTEEDTYGYEMLKKWRNKYGKVNTDEN